MTGQRFRPAEHLRRPADFRRAYDARRSASNAWLVVYAHPNGLTVNRVGLSVSKKHGGAVTRNAIRRRLRESYRRTKTGLPTGFDLVLVPRGPGLPAFSEMLAELPFVVRRAVQRWGPADGITA